MRACSGRGLVHERFQLEGLAMDEAAVKRQPEQRTRTFGRHGEKDQRNGSELGGDRMHVAEPLWGGTASYEGAWDSRGRAEPCWRLGLN